VSVHDFPKRRFIISPETGKYEDQFPVSGRAQISPSLGIQEGRIVNKETVVLFTAQYGIWGSVDGTVTSLWSG
jgi:hypothetical protein